MGSGSDVLRPTAFDDRLRAAGATAFDNAIGYAAPLWFTEPEAEYWAVRRAVGAMDFSFIRKYDVVGPGAVDTVNRLFTRDVAGLEPGRIAYGSIVDERGMMMDDVTVLVFAPDHVRLTCGTEAVGELLAASATAGQSVRDERDQIGHLCLQGPNSRALLQRLTGADVSNAAFPYYTYRRDLSVAGVPVHINRMGFTAELGYELWVPAAHAGTVWDAVFAAGAADGLRPIGILAVFMLRIEAGMIMGEGLEYDDTVSPFECRMGWAIDWDKGDFRGRDALAALQATAPNRLVTVAFPAGDDDLSGSALTAGDTPIGHITMSMPSPRLGGRLGLARVTRSHAAAGTPVRAASAAGAVDGEIVATPAYDPDRARVRS
jgi:aminomethyltransferase